jgi:hypothetical protein
LSDWTDMTALERVAKAIRDTEWSFCRTPPSRDYADSLPLTKMNLASAEAAIAELDRIRAEAHA